MFKWIEFAMHISRAAFINIRNLLTEFKICLHNVQLHTCSYFKNQINTTDIINENTY